MLNKKARGWCFTINLPDGWDEKPPLTEEPDCDFEYLIYQYEQGSHAHIQGYIYFKNARFGRSVGADIKNWSGISAHLELARGTPQQNKDYCSKEDTRIEGYGPFEFGSIAGQGKRSDLAECFNQFREQGLTDGLLEAFPSQLVMYHNKMKQLDNEIRHRGWVHVPDREPPKVIVLYGETGTGKTKAAHDAGAERGGTVMADYASRYLWGHYEGQEVVCFDEFDGQVKIYDMLKLLDRYNITVQVPYLGNRPWIPKIIFICSNLSPEQWWSDSKPAVTYQQRQALWRRFTEVYEMKYIIALDCVEKIVKKAPPE